MVLDNGFEILLTLRPGSYAWRGAGEMLVREACLRRDTESLGTAGGGPVVFRAPVRDRAGSAIKTTV